MTLGSVLGPEASVDFVDWELLGSYGAEPGITHLCYLGRTTLHVRSGQRLLAPKLPASPWVPEGGAAGLEHNPVLSLSGQNSVQLQLGTLGAAAGSHSPPTL